MEPSIPAPPFPFGAQHAPQTPLTLHAHGAEALLYRTTFLHPPRPAALKHRPSKPWRHPTLDARLTRQRVLAEARALARCARAGVAVPGLWALDAARGWLVLEWIAGGETVRDVLVAATAATTTTTGVGVGCGEEEVTARTRSLLRRVGVAVGRMHVAGVVHGDLTTSNMMVRGGGGAEGEVVLVDFGLATQGVQEEDRAVDLYVLERAFGASHPRQEAWFAEDVLPAYATSYAGARATLRRLEDVRMRGRKKSMIG